MSTAAAASRRDHRRRKLRIGIRQLGRGELNGVSLHSGEIDDPGIRENARRLIEQPGLRRRHLLQPKISA